MLRVCVLCNVVICSNSYFLSHAVGNVVQIGVVVVEIEYNWLRGTRDDGGRTSTTQIRINNRKLPSPMAVISHVSNVNHWLLSHDNIWAALPKDHPAVREHKAAAEAKKAASAEAADPATGSDSSTKPDLTKLSSTTDDSVRLLFLLSWAVNHCGIVSSSEERRD